MNILENHVYIFKLSGYLGRVLVHLSLDREVPGSNPTVSMFSDIFFQFGDIEKIQ